MDLVFSHETALRMWRDFATYSEPYATPCRAQRLPTDSKHVATAADDVLPGTGFAGDATHVLVGSDRARVKSRNLNCHVASAPMPEGSFYSLPYGAYIVSPELCLMQMASTCSFPQLISLGMEFCGTYAMNEFTEKGFDLTAVPLTTVRRIENFARKAAGAHGAAQLLRATQHILQMSNSPAETILVQRLCLNSKLGGRGLQTPLLNHRIVLSDSIAARLGRRYCVPDLYYPKEKLIIEYYGKNYHSKDFQFFRDAERSNLLGLLGLKLVIVTSAQLKYDPAFEELIRDVCKALGRRYRKPTERQLAKQGELCSTLQADWVRRELVDVYGRPLWSAESAFALEKS